MIFDTFATYGAAVPSKDTETDFKLYFCLCCCQYTITLPNIQAWPGLTQISKIKHFAKIDNGF